MNDLVGCKPDPGLCVEIRKAKRPLLAKEQVDFLEESLSGRLIGPEYVILAFK